jgi:hypothetical protein
MNVNAQTIEYGGEADGPSGYSPMGSGLWADAGFRFAAYQRRGLYIDTTHAWQWASLTPLVRGARVFQLCGPLLQRYTGSRHLLLLRRPRWSRLLS